MDNVEDYGTWWEPTLAGIRKAYENGDFGYDITPSIRLLLTELDTLQKQIDYQKDLLWVWECTPEVKLDPNRTIREQRLETERK